MFPNAASFMAYLVLILAALSRLVPHALHGIGMNFTAVGGGLLYFGARKSRWHAVAAVVVMASADVYLTRHVYGYPFHLHDYALTWIWYGLVCLMAHSALQRVNAVRVGAAVCGSAGSFFLLSNFAVWTQGDLYPHSMAGLGTCYAAAIPFLANDLVSTALTATILFGFPVLAGYLLQVWRSAEERQQPLL